MLLCICAGLAPSDAEDVAQDVLEWLLRTDQLALGRQSAWLAAVTQNFILRHRRKIYRKNAREGGSLGAVPEPRAAEALPGLEVNELLDRTAARLPETERKLLGLIRRGHSLAEAARILEIPRGSRTYHHERLVACARSELRRKTEIPIRGRADGRTEQPENPAAPARTGPPHPV